MEVGCATGRTVRGRAVSERTVTGPAPLGRRPPRRARRTARAPRGRGERPTHRRRRARRTRRAPGAIAVDPGVGEHHDLRADRAGAELDLEALEHRRRHHGIALPGGLGPRGEREVGRLDRFDLIEHQHQIDTGRSQIAQRHLHHHELDRGDLAEGGGRRDRRELLERLGARGGPAVAALAHGVEEAAERRDRAIAHRGGRHHLGRDLARLHAAIDLLAEAHLVLPQRLDGAAPRGHARRDGGAGGHDGDDRTGDEHDAQAARATIGAVVGRHR